MCLHMFASFTFFAFFGKCKVSRKYLLFLEQASTTGSFFFMNHVFICCVVYRGL